MLRKIISLVLSFGLLFQQASFAQVAAELNIANYLSRIGSNIVQDKFRPLHLRYFSYDSLNDNFKVLLDKGDLKKLDNVKVQESTKILLSYFLIGVTLPDSIFWVNLRPDSEDQIIDKYLEKTDVGKIMLEADLQLKKDTALFTSPQTTEGREYWNRLYKKASELYGYDNVTIPTLTRPWIVPGEIIVRESKDSAYVYKANLKVMLEQDYLKDSTTYNFKDERSKALNEYSSQLIRELIIPKLTKEVNSSKRYAPLRQVYYSLILSRWFKLRFTGKTGTYASLINTRNLTSLTSQEAWSKTDYFKQYQKSFKDGEYNIKEPVYTPTGQVVRSYFSGGINIASSAINTQNGIILPNDNANKLGDIIGGKAVVDPRSINLKPTVVSSPIKNSGEELASSTVSFKYLQNTLRTSTNIYADIVRMAKKDATTGVSAIGMLFPNFDKLETVRKWNSNMLQHTLEFIDTLEKVRDNNEKAINAAKRNVDRPELRPGLVKQYQELFNALFLKPADKEFIFLLALLHDIGAYDGTVGHEDKGAVWINNNLSIYSQDKLLIEKIKWLIGQHVAIGTMFFGERTPHRLLRLLNNELPGLNLQEKNDMLRMLALITFSDGGVMIDNDRADYYLATDLQTLENRKPGFLLYRLSKLVSLKCKEQDIMPELNKLYTILGPEGKKIFEKQVGENLDALDYGLAFFGSIVGRDKYSKEEIDLIIKVFCIFSFIAEIEDSKNEDIKWWVEFVGLNEKGNKVALELKPEQVQKLKELKFEDLTFEKVKDAYKSYQKDDKQSLFGIFKLERGMKVFESKPAGKGREQPMLSVSLHPQAAASSGIGLLGGLGPEAFTKNRAEDWLSRFWAIFPGREATLYSLYVKVKDKMNAYRTYRDDTVRHKDTDGKFFVQYLPYPPDYSKYTSPRTEEEADIQINKEKNKNDPGYYIDRQFTRAYKQNVVGQPWESFIAEEMIEGVSVTFFDAPKPYGAGHVVLIPRMLDNIPQLLTEEAIKVALKLISNSKYGEHLKIGFNALKAWASTDQLHLQPLFFEDEKGNPSEMPVEKFATQLLLTKDGVSISELTDYPTRGFVLRGDDTTSLTRVLFAAVSILQKNASGSLPFTPYNLIFAKEKNGQIKVLLFPRTEQSKIEPYQIGAGFVELSGILQTSDNNISDRIIKDGVDNVAQQELSRISLTQDQFKALKEKLGFSSSSAVNTPVAPGGIDFRALPMIIQPMGSFSGLNFNLPQLSQAELRQINVGSEIQQIKNMVQSGIIPSGQRIKELVAACIQKKEMNSQIDNLLLCLADIFRLEEENISESSPELREALVIVDSQS